LGDTNGHAHGAGCTCATCDPRGGQPAPRQRISAVRVRARGEDFRIVQVQGNLFVCSRANGNCCCGWEEKGRWVFDNQHWADEWERRRIRNRLHLTFTGCLGPCAVDASPAGAEPAAHCAVQTVVRPARGVTPLPVPAAVAGPVPLSPPIDAGPACAPLGGRAGPPPARAVLQVYLP